MQELRPWIGRAPFAEPPEIAGFRLQRIELLNLVRASLLGILLIPVWAVLFAIVPVLSGADGIEGTITPLTFLVAIVFVALLIIVHELLHGVAILASGNIPSFGAGPGFFYTTCHSPLARNAYIFVALLPLLAINLAAVGIAAVWPGAMGWMLFLSILNTMGAGGDIWMFIRLVGEPRSSLIVDLASGFAVYHLDQATTASAVES